MAFKCSHYNGKRKTMSEHDLQKKSLFGDRKLSEGNNSVVVASDVFLTADDSRIIWGNFCTIRDRT